MVGAKNMHSSSGCAVTRSTLPGAFREFFSLIFFNENHITNTMKRITIEYAGNIII